MPEAHEIQTLAAAQQQVAATLAAAIITASERPWSVHQAIELMRDIGNTMHPQPNAGYYKEWAKTKDQRLSKVHGATG